MDTGFRTPLRVANHCARRGFLHAQLDAVIAALMKVIARPIAHRCPDVALPPSEWTVGYLTQRSGSIGGPLDLQTNIDPLQRIASTQVTHRTARARGDIASVSAIAMLAGFASACAAIAAGCATAPPPAKPASEIASVAARIGTCRLKVRFVGLDARQGKGPIQVALWDSEPSFMKDGAWLRGASVPIESAVDPAGHGILFEGLPEGRYAISAFHDTRSAGKLRQGAFGIPIDPWAISNAGAAFAPPAWKTASFEVRGGSTVIELDFQHHERHTP